ncbi:NAD(P)/FAD-dependent oxidoreductase [Shimia thalassica]|uniref:FAD/NAD(P)-dependent oxidoreductase n=1 Tax=Shimia thalassica TaxID=1715693 RepID=UPI002733690C|nr:NAD(P)/FAD-dependent oxidoreductase [Shimia thalassica]MDP2519581.1 NAD(P)/FAD-dependent oxidoreductase [Shimia thalassica]
MTDLIIIGAGPAGMAAAATAARGGAKVVLLDEQPRAGGQIYRNVTINNGRVPHLGEDYSKGAHLAAGLDHPNITCFFGSTVWRVEAGPSVVVSRHKKSRRMDAPHILIATGAQERPTPFPGWTLPGVMPAGAAQILMKSSDLMPRNAVLAGTGPLLYLIASQMIDADRPPLALVETQTPFMLAASLVHLPRALLDRHSIFKGLGLLRKIRKAGVARYTSARAFRATPDENRLQFQFTSKGKPQSLLCDLVLSHQGVVPATQLSRAAGVPHVWNKAQRCWQPERDDEGKTPVDGIWIAGDSGGIHGADAARAEGVIAANAILCRLHGLRPEVAPHVNAHALNHRFRARAIRPFLDAAYAPAQEFLTPPDDAIVCRCEETTAGDLRLAMRNGASDLRHLKAATRAGMGPCQGRMCGLTLANLLSEHTGQNLDTIAPLRVRSPIKPVTLGELAALDRPES